MVRKICGGLAALLFLAAFCGMFAFPPSWDNGSREDPFQAGRVLSGTPQAIPDPATQVLAITALILFTVANILLWPQVKPFWSFIGAFFPSEEEMARLPHSSHRRRSPGEYE